MYIYIYRYVYTGIYNQIPLFFCAHCLPKKNAIGGGIRNGMTCNKKNKQQVGLFDQFVKFLSVCPTHAWPVSVSSTAAAAHQRRIMVGSNPTYQKYCDMCVIFLIFEKLPRTFKDLEVFRRNSLHDFLEAERTVGCVLGCHFVWKCLSRNCLMILDSMTHPSPHGSPVESLWKQMAPSGIINRRYWPNDSKSCRGFEPAVPGCMERNSHL